MEQFEIVIALLLAGAVLAALARRIGAPYPALLALAGTAGAVVPGLPEVALDPELALALFVAPALLDAAFDASPRDLRDNLLPVGGLAVAAVLLTTAAVAVVARWLVPEMPWAAAVALGAIVAPPDAAAASAVLRQVGLPQRLLVVLEGESLFNDATALLVFRLALGAAAAGSFSPWEALPTLALTCGGGAALGYALARAYVAVAHRLFDEIGTAVLVQFLSTFGVWLVAEALHVSAIITVVAYAMTLARIVPVRTGARHRIASYAVWEVAVFVLNALAFILIGLQLRGILHRLDGDVGEALLFAGAACLVVVAVRFAWAMGVNVFVRWQYRRFGPAAGAGRPLARPTLGGGIVISWCGMRGIVTLAAALALPEGFPFRDLILLTAFAVVLVTLVAQGLTLRWLLGRVRLPEDDSVEREVVLARAETARAALGALDGAPERLREKYEARLRPAAEDGAGLSAFQEAAVEAQRRRLDALRSAGSIGDTAFHLVEEEIDLLELAGDPRLRPGGAAA